MAIVFPVAPGTDGIDVGLLGLEQYGASYVVQGTDGVALVEVGTSLGVPRLQAGLQALGIAPERITHILCTHVHMDHAGAAGHLAELCPRAFVVVHSRSQRHLADPARLVSSVSEAVGPLFPLYGELRPVPPERLLAGEELRLDLGGGVRLEAVSTPGHSRDHLAFFAPYAGVLFSGDAAGVSIFDHTLLRPVTAPPAFDPQAMLGSLETMRALRPVRLCFTHFGYSDQPDAVFDRLGEILRRWDDLARTEGLAAAGAAVFAANLPPAGTPPETLWRQLAEMNRRGFLLAYGA